MSLDRSTQLAPQAATVQYRYGLALYLAGRLDEAELALGRAVDLEPNSVDVVLALALFYQKLQRYADALPLAEHVVELQPDNAGYQDLLRQIRAQAR